MSPDPGHRLHKRNQRGGKRCCTIYYKLFAWLLWARSKQNRISQYRGMISCASKAHGNRLLLLCRMQYIASTRAHDHKRSELLNLIRDIRFKKKGAQGRSTLSIELDVGRIHYATPPSSTTAAVATRRTNAAVRINTSFEAHGSYSRAKAS